ncbi:MAG TPA: DNA adenine methylase [Candidatus Ornithoclostridium faecavium]|nr:DNA adenine methylase [Candidatus Ornithoclostridium faecavium]
MNYIGSKYSLIDFLETSIDKTLKLHNETKKPSEMVFADLFAGTGVVSGSFKQQGYSIIANDIQYYSYVITKHIIENNGNLDKERCNHLIEELNNLDGIEGFIYQNYSFGGTEGQEFRRMYFSDFNAKKCDAIRIAIESWLKQGKINEHEYFFLLGSLLNSIDKYANTASVYGAYLKTLKKSALKEMELVALPIMKGTVECKVYNEDISELINNVSGDILYLDPPYNARQYCTNYHLLETIAKYDNPKIKGKTGLRDYTEQKSVFCNKSKVADAFSNLIKNAKFKYIFLSYNNEGLMSFETIEKIMRKYGKYKVYMQQYRRFKADNARDAKSDSTIEYLHCLVKEDI